MAKRKRKKPPNQKTVNDELKELKSDDINYFDPIDCLDGVDSSGEITGFQSLGPGKSRRMLKPQEDI